MTAGWVKLTADGSGGVKKATSGDEYLVVSTGDGALTLILTGYAEKHGIKEV